MDHLKYHIIKTQIIIVYSGLSKDGPNVIIALYFMSGNKIGGVQLNNELAVLEQAEA